jgi:uncharacterized membrane protein (UPF0127 family)
MSSTQRQFRLTTSAGTTIAGAVVIADNPWQRFKGLMGKRELAAGSGLCLRPCSSIHMFFMRIPLDVVFMDGDGEIVHICHSIKPWRMSRIVRHAKAAIELPAGTMDRLGVKKGDVLQLA